MHPYPARLGVKICIHTTRPELQTRKSAGVEAYSCVTASKGISIDSPRSYQENKAMLISFRRAPFARVYVCAHFSNTVAGEQKKKHTRFVSWSVFRVHVLTDPSSLEDALAVDIAPNRLWQDQRELLVLLQGRSDAADSIDPFIHLFHALLAALHFPCNAGD